MTRNKPWPPERVMARAAAGLLAICESAHGNAAAHLMLIGDSDATARDKAGALAQRWLDLVCETQMFAAQIEAAAGAKVPWVKVPGVAPPIKAEKLHTWTWGDTTYMGNIEYLTRMREKHGNGGKR